MNSTHPTDDTRATLTDEQRDAARDRAMRILGGAGLMTLRDAGLAVVDAAQYQADRSDALRWRQYQAICDASDDGGTFSADLVPNLEGKNNV